jgi:alkylated DNA repair protein (DNA oxidative demethylase)
MSVQITCLGWHWYPYRYSRTVDDGDGRTVAPFPGWLEDLGRRAVADARAIDAAVEGAVEAGGVEEAGKGTGGDRTGYVPDVALINWYRPEARMGMHVDRDEPSPAPVVSFSLGDTGVFRFGNVRGRGRPWTDVRLESGDLFVFGGPSRRAYHGVPKVLPVTGHPDIGLEAGRFNITLRQSGLEGDNTPGKA